MGAAVDPVGNGFAIIALVGMVVVLGGSLRRLHRGFVPTVTAVWWQIPVVALLGVGVAVYLMVMAARPETAVCLPLEDCRVLQDSRFAYPFGVPVGLIAFGGNLVILLVWLWGQFGPDASRRWALWLLFSITFLGELFAIYFIFLEPFVIHATCAYCLASGVLMTILLWQSAEAFGALRTQRFIFPTGK